MSEQHRQESDVPDYVVLLRDPLVRKVALIITDSPRDRFHDLVEEGQVNWECHATWAIRKAAQIVGALCPEPCGVPYDSTDGEGHEVRLCTKAKGHEPPHGDGHGPRNRGGGES